MQLILFMHEYIPIWDDNYSPISDKVILSEVLELGNVSNHFGEKEVADHISMCGNKYVEVGFYWYNYIN